jgi:hypothetical protein
MRRYACLKSGIATITLTTITGTASDDAASAEWATVETAV